MIQFLHSCLVWRVLLLRLPYSNYSFICSCALQANFTPGEWWFSFWRTGCWKLSPSTQPSPKHILNLKLQLKHQRYIFQCAILPVVNQTMSLLASVSAISSRVCHSRRCLRLRPWLTVRYFIYGLLTFKEEKIFQLKEKWRISGFWLVFQQPISKLPFASVSKRVFVRNPSFETPFHHTFIFVQIKLLSIWKIFHEDLFWNRDKRQLRNGLLIYYFRNYTSNLVLLWN